MTKVAVFGPNKWCNYGDDLQSLVFALHLRSLGYEPVVYKLDSVVAAEHGLATADTMDELVRDVRLCIIAGGALLKPILPPKRVLKKDFIEFENDFRRMHAAGRKYGVKFCAISMGGDGKVCNAHFWFSRHRNRFFRSEYFLNGTVRLTSDVEQMRQFGKTFEFFPDCLFSLRRFLDVEPRVPREPHRPLRIGFNFRKRHLPTRFVEDIHAYAATHDDIEFHFATTHMDKVIYDYGINYEYIPEQETDNLKFVHYRNPRQLLQFVAGLDVFVASKLHLGLTGLLVGTPFLSFTGMGKTDSFLRSIGGERAILAPTTSFASLVAPDGVLRRSKSELMTWYDGAILQRMVDESWRQFEFCTKVVRQYA